MKMEADIKSAILSARKPASPQAARTAIKDAERSESIALEDYTSQARIAPESDSPFVSSFNRDRIKGTESPTVVSYKWADGHLKKNANRMERCILAVRDAARCAEIKKLDPGVDEIYVTAAIRKGWNLSPDQLSKGLKSLEGKRMIKFTNQRKGRHARFVLIEQIYCEGL